MIYDKYRGKNTGPQRVKCTRSFALVSYLYGLTHNSVPYEIMVRLLTLYRRN
jgi:hypothetical protein